jgi:methylthioribose-1-phosphate isomerase
MKINGKHYRTIWVKEGNDRIIQVIDQRYLPHEFVIEDLVSLPDAVTAIKDMHVRGAGLIGVTAGYGMYLATLEAPGNSSFDDFMEKAGNDLKSSRPTAVNLSWAVDRQIQAIKKGRTPGEKSLIALKTAGELADHDAGCSRLIGRHGLEIISDISRKKGGKTVNILTHCNAGWLAFVDYGAATSPIYAAFDIGIDIHVWVDETRPRNQGASLTAWELENHGVRYTVIPDNAGGHLMQHGMVDMVLVGSDRTTFTGDVANKTGTYLKALAARDNNVPFYVALPSSTIDWQIEDGIKEIPIEERGADEVRYIEGLCEGEIKRVLLTPKNSRAANYAFDVTPARLVTGLITERGICKPERKSILEMFPEKNNSTLLSNQKIRNK